MIITLVLPKGGPAPTEQFVASMPGETLKGAEPVLGRYARSDQQMDVVGHNHEGREMVALETGFAVGESLDHHPCDLRLSQEEGAALCLIQNSVHGHEGSTGSQTRRWEDTVGRKAAMQTEGHKQGVSDYFPVWETALILPHHGVVAAAKPNSQVRADETALHHHAGPKPGGRCAQYGLILGG